ncbi:hypothetical protein V6L77_00805 [Pannonibacter sp. Pt2-lr]
MQHEHARLDLRRAGPRHWPQGHGEDYTDIALRLNRPRLEVVRQVALPAA